MVSFNFWMIGRFLIYAGPVGYITVWILYFMITMSCDLPEFQKNIFFIYTLVPWGAVCTSSIGYLVSVS
jgi:hypothetical protein